MVEVVGRCFSEEEHAALEDKTYAVGFPDAIVDAKRAAGDPLHFIDPTTHGGMWRFVNDSQEAPNLCLCYHPKFEKPSPSNGGRGVLPTRAYLKAKHDIAPGVELTFNYGGSKEGRRSTYPRSW